jgi:uncharacterized protein (TIGR02598 family)
VITKFLNRNDRSIAAFSLVEVVLALSIMSFACVTLIGLLATGLTSVQKSTTTTVQAQIIQDVANLVEVNPYTVGFNTNMYFDDEGTSLSSTLGSLYTATVTSTTAYSAYTNNTGTPYTTANAQLLQIQITSKINPTTTNTFNLVWPNTGS